MQWLAPLRGDTKNQECQGGRSNGKLKYVRGGAFVCFGRLSRLKVATQDSQQGHKRENDKSYASKAADPVSTYGVIS